MMTDIAFKYNMLEDNFTSQETNFVSIKNITEKLFILIFQILIVLALIVKHIYLKIEQMKHFTSIRLCNVM